jgi:NADPH2:quinone reductase
MNSNAVDGRRMRAWQNERAAGYEHLAIAELALPEPAAGEVLVEVQACGLNFSDLLMLSGTYQVKPPLPFIAGQEIAGRIVRVPAGSAWRTGQRVASKVLWGGFAEYACTRDEMLIALPEGMSYAAGATLPVVWPTAWIALFERARLRAGETVLVHAAAGGVGLAAVQLAREAGAVVIAGVGTEAKASVAREAGAAHTVDTRSPAWIDEVARLTQGKGADVIFDPVGADLAEPSLKSLARDGRYLIVGFAGGKIPALPAGRLLLKNASALGVYWSHDRDRELVARALDSVLTSWKAGKLKIEASTMYPFDKLREALADLAARRTIGKCVLVPKKEQ